MNAAAAALVVLNGRQAFNPRASLFAHNEQGFWYDPSDLSSMFQDSAGTTPVTAVEQAVGLILDKIRGLVLGPELLSGSGTASGSWAYSASNVITRNGSSSGSVQAAPVAIAGRTYLVQFTVANLSGDTFFFRCGNTASGNITANGAYQYRITAASAQSIFQAAPWGGSAGEVTITLQSIRELAGNHAIQPTSASRPTLRARYNLLTYSEDFSNAAWLKAVATVSGQTVTASAGAGFHYISRNDNTVTGSVTVMWEVKRDNNDWLFFTINDSAGVNYFNIATGAFGATNPDGLTATALEDGWYRITGSKTLAAQVLNCGAGVATGNGGGSFTAAGTEKFLIRKVDARRTIDAISGIPSYQRIAAATDYDTVGFPPYLAFDGSDDSLYTGGNVDFSATDKMTVWAGVTKLSDAATGMLAELGATAASAGAFGLQARNDADSYRFEGGGTTFGIAVNATGFPAPTTNVVSGLGDISGDRNIIRVDGTQRATSTNDQGTGNYANAVLNIGRRNNASLPFNGRVYALIGRGATTSAALIQQAERWVASKQGRTL